MKASKIGFKIMKTFKIDTWNAYKIWSQINVYAHQHAVSFKTMSSSTWCSSLGNKRYQPFWGCNDQDDQRLDGDDDDDVRICMNDEEDEDDHDDVLWLPFLCGLFVRIARWSNQQQDTREICWILIYRIWKSEVIIWKKSGITRSLNAWIRHLFRNFHPLRQREIWDPPTPHLVITKHHNHDL